LHLGERTKEKVDEKKKKSGKGESGAFWKKYHSKLTLGVLYLYRDQDVPSFSPLPPSSPLFPPLPPSFPFIVVSIYKL